MVRSFLFLIVSFLTSLSLLLPNGCLVVNALRTCDGCVNVVRSGFKRRVKLGRLRSETAYCPVGYVLVDHECSVTSGKFSIRAESNYLSETAEGMIRTQQTCTAKARRARVSTTLKTEIVCMPVLRAKGEQVYYESRRFSNVPHGRSRSLSVACPTGTAVMESQCYSSNGMEFRQRLKDATFTPIDGFGRVNQYPSSINCNVQATNVRRSTTLTALVTCVPLDFTWTRSAHIVTRENRVTDNQVGAVSGEEAVCKSFTRGSRRVVAEITAFRCETSSEHFRIYNYVTDSDDGPFRSVGCQQRRSDGNLLGHRTATVTVTAFCVIKEDLLKLDDQ